MLLHLPTDDAAEAGRDALTKTVLSSLVPFIVVPFLVVQSSHRPT